MSETKMTPQDQASYDKALGRIERCFRRRGVTLSLRRLNLTKIPPDIGKLTSLRQLDASGNRLATLPPEIAKLSSLRSLELTGNHLTILPPEIGDLTALEVLHLSSNRLPAICSEVGNLNRLKLLDCSNNELTILPPEIGNLPELRELHLHGNRLEKLPSEINNLSNLTRLLLSNNPLTALPSGIGRLSSLSSIFISSVELVALPPEIGQLAGLTTLDLTANRLTNLPPEIGNLIHLRNLYLDHNQLASLPREIKNLPLLKGLYLHGNPELGLPAEVLGPIWQSTITEKASAKRPSEILDYYFAHQQAAEAEGTEALMEAKVLVLGEASVGKSCLIAALTQNKRRLEVPDTGTRGIVRALWEAPVKAGEHAPGVRGKGTKVLRLNCWDFGGQEIYHSAHTLFLTTRAVYLIVISKRDNERQNNTDYWLRMAASFGGPDAVIYLVVNKCDEEVGYPPDENALRLRHPGLRGFLETSCDNLQGIPEARKVIIREALRLNGVQQEVARTWLTVKKKLEKMPNHTLSMTEWAKLCGKKISTPEGQRELLYLCDQLGTVRYFPTTKEKMVDACDTAILNPEWVTLGIYALLDDENLKKQGGLLDRLEMTIILEAQGYPVQHERIIEEVMRRYDLLYDSADHGKEHRMLIPLMLPERMPDFKWPEDDILEFRYQYQVMPAGLLPAFTARMHRLLSTTPPPWRHGCVLAMKSCEALILADLELKRVQISIKGPAEFRREALDEIRLTFSALHGAIDKLPVDELIPVPGRPDAPPLRYRYLLSLIWKEIEWHDAEGATFGEIIRVNVREALDGVRGRAQTKRDRQEQLRFQELHLHTHHHDTKMSNTNDHSTNIGGDNYGQAGQTLANCTNMIQQQAPGKRKELLSTLDRQVRDLIEILPQEKKGEVPQIEENLEMLIKQATAPKPNRRWYDVSAEGLMEASKYVKDFSGNIAGTIKNIGKSLWPEVE